jgi:lysophospholipase L1-like esterase
LLRFLIRMNAMPQPSRVVACLGSSSTAARGSYDWIADLRSRPRNAGFQFLNFGVGGDLAFNALQRLPSVVECRPQKIVVLIGANDVLARVSRKLRWFLRAWKFLPQRPSPRWFEFNLRRIVVELKQQTDARIGLCSLAPIGEDPHSTDPLQSEINRRIADYGAIIQRIAQAENTAYIRFRESLSAQIQAQPGRSLHDIGIFSMYRDAFRQFVLHRSVDQIAAANGWRFHTDGIHLNSRGGVILANLVQEFIDGC